MSVKPFINSLWVFAGLVLATASTPAQGRLVIDMGASLPPQPSSKVIHYGGTGSVRHSEQRSYQNAQSRHSVRAASSRTGSAPAQSRTTVRAGDRNVVADAQSRSHSEASVRHGSVRLDTIR